MKKTFFAENEALGSAEIVEVKPAEVIIVMTKQVEEQEEQKYAGLDQRIMHVEDLTGLISRWKLLRVIEVISK